MKYEKFPKIFNREEVEAQGPFLLDFPSTHRYMSSHVTCAPIHTKPKPHPHPHPHPLVTLTHSLALLLII